MFHLGQDVLINGAPLGADLGLLLIGHVHLRAKINIGDSLAYRLAPKIDTISRALF